MRNRDKFKLSLRGTRGRRLKGKPKRGLLIVVIAALLLELLSAAQYYYTRNLMEQELEKRAEMELTTKAIITKGIIESSERTLKSHIMEVKNNLTNPDSLWAIMAWTLKYSPHLKGCGIAFNPGFYEDREYLFEPYALRTDSGIQCLQVAGERFDYTKDGFYRSIQEKKANSWVGPYDDVYLRKRLVSFAVPIYDFTGDTVAVLGIDIDTHNLGDTLNYRHIYPSSFDFLLTEEGELIAGPTDPDLQKKVEKLVCVINDSTVKKSWSKEGRVRLAAFYDEEAGDELSVFYANMKGQPHWQIAVVCYDDEVYGSLIKLRVRLLLLSLLAFAVLLFVVWRFASGVRKLEQKTLEQERMNGELRIASDIQQTLLPAHEPSLTGIDDVQVEGRLIPAKAVGGDLYNAFVRDGKLFFCIGDVSGKGVPSALIMAITQALFRNIASRESNPARIMSQLNETACRNNEGNIFVTLFIGVLDLPTGHLRYCNAGHELPIIVESLELRVKSTVLEALPNLPIGIFDDFHYEMETLVMTPGLALFLYTDGLTEGRNSRNQLFGRERVLQMTSDCGSTDPKQLVETATAQVRLFSENTEQSDDLTLLAIRYTPSREQDIMSEELILHNDVKEVEKLGTFVKQVSEQLNLDKSLTGKLRLAVEEAVVNVMEYAYPSGSKGEVSIRATFNGKRLKFIITDSGISFNPTEVLTADTTLSVEERPIGGLGILLVRELMDSVNYERINGKNVLTLSKIV
jgi:sigma-B regulation protein RsbU (phosphoserine phosphatase)